MVKRKATAARPKADQGHTAALDSLIAALGRKPPIDQQEVQRAAQELAALPDDVFDWGTNTRLAALTTELRTSYLWGPPESIPATPSPSLLRGLKELREEIGGPVAAAVSHAMPTFSLTTRLLNMNGKAFLLSRGERDVLAMLVRERTASIVALREVNAHPDRILKNLRDKFPALKKHITLPGGAGKGGYGTTIVATE